MLGAIVFAVAQNLFYEFWDYQFWGYKGFLSWQNIFTHKFDIKEGRFLAFLGTSQFACEILGLLCAGVFTSWPIYLGIRKFIWKR